MVWLVGYFKILLSSRYSRTKSIQGSRIACQPTKPTTLRMIRKPVELSPPHALDITELIQLCNVFKCLLRTPTIAS